MADKSLGRYAWLSIVAAIATITLKTAAYLQTHSVGILSDALESTVNLAAAVLALWMIRVAERPPDDDHEFGHNKAEYFSSAAEGILIFVAAAGIVYSALKRLINPIPLEALGLGVGISLIATGINLIVGLILIKVGKDKNSIVLEADGHHLLTDVWTTMGILMALGLVAMTGWQPADPIAALVVSVGIAFTGFKLVRRSVLGLMDASMPDPESAKVRAILDEYKQTHEVDFHAIRSRRAGQKNFVYFHLLVPDNWTVKEGHDLSHEIEERVIEAVPETAVFIHLEPLHDPASQDDIELFQ
ncbi:MAG: cation diffusion facilitator family transporter [Pyrinomonadaceae bacterium]